MIYLLVFSLSSIFLYLAEKQINSLNKKILTCIALLFPILLATLRDEKVGIDVETYMKPLYLCSMRSKNISELFANMKAEFALMHLDYGYALMGYFASKITGGLWGIFLFNSLFCILPIYFGIVKYNKYIKCDVHVGTREVPIWAAMFIFYCLFYNNSLNQVRQIITCALLFYGLMSLLRKEYFRCIFIFLIACTFHKASVIFLYIVLLYFIAKSKHNILRIVLLFLLLVFFIFSIQIFYLGMNVLNALGLIPDKYYGEIFDKEYGQRDVNLSWLFIALVMLLMTALNLYKNRNDVIGRFLFMITCSFLALFNLSSYFSSFGRIQLYFMIYASVCLPLFATAGQSFIKESRLVSNMICVAVPLLYWFVACYLFDYTGTIPYYFI